MSLRKLAKLKDVLEMSLCAAEFYGMSFQLGAPYWICSADRV